LPDKCKVRFWYDAFGRRVKKEVFPAELADFKAMALLALEKGTGALPRTRVIEYLWDGDVLAAEIERGRGARAGVGAGAQLDAAAQGATGASTGASASTAAEPWSRFHVHEPGTFAPVLQEEAGAVFAVVNDHLGMPKELIDPAGRVAW